jgi:predicted dehydrogenase
MRSEFFRRALDGAATVYADFDTMLDRETPDGVIVTTTDNTHAQYIIRSLDRGIDVISEKPICNTYADCVAIRDAERRSGKRVTVGFNCRFMPYFAKLKELILSDTIGKIYAVNYEYCLNRHHGGDYFKRWHRHMQVSAGMLVHKSTHHFDIANWLLGDLPISVSAMGTRSFYGNPEKSFANRCTACPKASSCESYKSQSAAYDKELYFDAEGEDGYIRDHCAYLPDTDIYDNMSVSVAYAGGALLTYSLNLFSMREGYRITLTGERGVILGECFSTGYGVDDKFVVTVLRGESDIERIEFEKSSGAHGGGDAKLLDMIFGGKTDDPLMQTADSFAGFASAMIGIGANESIKTGKAYDLRTALDSLK